MDSSNNKAEVSESIFEYLLAEILNLQPPDAPDDEQVMCVCVLGHIVSFSVSYLGLNYQ